MKMSKWNVDLRGDTYGAPLMYQSDGALGIESMPSLATLKYTISGASPLGGHQYPHTAPNNIYDLRRSVVCIHASLD